MAPEEGFIAREGLKKIAVYKDAQGIVHCHSTLCPHLGGCVRWNPEEKRWECPCHRSRFDCLGKVITGPAISDLKPLDHA
ncbi:MAG: Rieske 2Fe-2S domain-containing protein [Parachlamydia sp.]|nr:Rieske 2Fe-2S domain-containing protein [Parachlamydia sp.]